MGRDDGRRDDWGRDAYYDRQRDRDHYRDRSYDRDDRRQSYGRDDRRGYGGADRHGYGRDDRRSYDRADRYSYNRNDRHGYSNDSYDRHERRQTDRYRGDKYRSRGGRDRPYRGGSRGRGRFGGGDRFQQDQDEIDKEEQEYINKRQEVLKARRAEEEQYVAEDVDTAALAAMGLPTGFGAPREREAIEEGLRSRGDAGETLSDSTELTENQDRIEGNNEKNITSNEQPAENQPTTQTSVDCQNLGVKANNDENISNEQTSEQVDIDGDSEARCDTEGKENFTNVEDVSRTDPRIQESSQADTPEAS